MKRNLLLTCLLQLCIVLGFSQTLLYDQINNVTTGGILCRTHTTTTSQIYDTEGADDFTVPTGEVWKVDSIVALGFYNTTALSATPTRITVYEDSSGHPGSTVVYTTMINDGDPDDDGDLEPYLSDQPTFGPGTYWLSVGIHTSSVPWYWHRINEYVSPNPFNWKNQGGGYGVCTTWYPLYSCSGLGVFDSSAAFQVWGCINPPQLDPLPDDTTLCEGETLTLTANSSTSGVTYAWSTGDSTQSIVADIPNIYTVSVTAPGGGCTQTSSIMIDFVMVPEPMIEDDTICEDAAVPSVFGPAGACPNCLVTWSDGSHGQFYSTQTQGWIWVTIEDTVFGCSQTDSAYVTVESTTATISQGELIDVCIGDTVVLSAFQTFDTYEWLQYDGLNWNFLSSNPTAMVTEGGDVALKGTTPAGCIARDSSEVNEHENPVPTIVFTTKINGKVELTATLGYQSYAWSNGDDEAQIIVNSNGIYTVTVTDEYGCQGTAFINVYTVGDDESSTSELKIYPNPASQVLSIQLPETWTGAELTLHSMDGRRVFEKRLGDKMTNIDVSGLATGVYTLKLEIAQGEVNSKLIISH